METVITSKRLDELAVLMVKYKDEKWYEEGIGDAHSTAAFFDEWVYLFKRKGDFKGWQEYKMKMYLDHLVSKHMDLLEEYKKPSSLRSIGWVGSDGVISSSNNLTPYQKRVRLREERQLLPKPSGKGVKIGLEMQEFLKEGGFQEFYAERDQMIKLEKENLELSNKKMRYEETLRQQEKEISDLTEENLKLGNEKMDFDKTLRQQEKEISDLTEENLKLGNEKMDFDKTLRQQEKEISDLTKENLELDNEKMRYEKTLRKVKDGLDIMAKVKELPKVIKSAVELGKIVTAELIFNK